MRRRDYIKVKRELKRVDKKPDIHSCRSLIALSGLFIKHSDSYRFRKKYHTKRIVRKARRYVEREDQKMDEATHEAFERLMDENNRQNHRIQRLEDAQTQITQLALSVQKLAQAVEAMTKEQAEQGKRLKVIEEIPAKRWTNAMKTAFTSIVGVIAGALAVGLIQLIAQHV